MTNEGQNPEVFYGYSAYGETQALGVDGDIPNNSNQYTARENDGLVGGTNGGALYYYRARYYDPVLKRFVSEDPIGLRGGFNVLTYVGGNPLNHSDPRGLDDPSCMCEGGPRLPDFVSASLSVAVPFTGNLGSWTFSVSVDRNGNWYWSPIGPGVGRALTFVSGSATANWLIQGCKPTKEQLSNFLSGHGFTIAGGYWGGANAIYSPGNGWAAGLGFVSPQLGGNYSYSWQGKGNAGGSW
jgi:RHS repeat-associated protein